MSIVMFGISLLMFFSFWVLGLYEFTFCNVQLPAQAVAAGGVADQGLIPVRAGAVEIMRFTGDDPGRQGAKPATHLLPHLINHPAQGSWGRVGHPGNQYQVFRGDPVPLQALVYGFVVHFVQTRLLIEFSINFLVPPSLTYSRKSLQGGR